MQSLGGKADGRPATAVIHIFSLISKDAPPDQLEQTTLMLRFGAEQLLGFLKAQRVDIIIVAPTPGTQQILEGIKADASISALLKATNVITTGSLSSLLASNGKKAQENGGDGHAKDEGRSRSSLSLSSNSKKAQENGEDGQGSSSSPSSLIEIVCAVESSNNDSCPHQCSGGGENGQGTHLHAGGNEPIYLVIGLTHASSDNGRKRLIAESISCPSSSSSNPSTNGSSSAIIKASQEFDTFAEIDLERFGLPRLVIDVQNPPFLWPRDYERQPATALLIEARWWDPDHGQLNLILGRGIDSDNVLEAIEAETHRMDGELASGLESVFVTVRHDFGIMATLLANGYKIHHAAGGGTQVVLLRLFTKVEVPTAGTHISRSKVLLYRTKIGPGNGKEVQEVFLFRRRAKGIWKMPGGHVEMKELADEAAVREVHEETGYSCKIVGMVALTERKDVGKKWGCSQLMFTFAAEWIDSEMKLDDAVSREGKWFPFEEVDALVARNSALLDPPLVKIWPAFRAKDGWLVAHPHVVDVGYESRKRYYMSLSAAAPSLSSSITSCCKERRANSMDLSNQARQGLGEGEEEGQSQSRLHEEVKKGLLNGR